MLGTQALTNFLRAANEEDAPLAIRLANEDLDVGGSLEALLFPEDEPGFDLVARPIAARKYTIEFGYLANGTAGDGGEWVVRFDEQDRVLEVTGGVQWIA